jgi:hypothetical protein
VGRTGARHRPAAGALRLGGRVGALAPADEGTF